MAIPVRRCLACRRRTTRDDLVRFVVADGTVVVDPLARRPGRGAYVCTRPTCLDAALDRRGATLVRALRTDPGRVSLDEDVLREAMTQSRELAPTGSHEE